MPAKKQTAKKGTKTKKPTAPQQQGELFQADPTTANNKNASGMVQVTFYVPQGVPITLGASGLPEQKPSQPSQAVLKAIGRLTREETRKVVEEAKLSHNEIINLTTALHGQLYRLASIGGKVTRR